MAETQGKLYMVGVPIGNYGDMTYRGVEILHHVDAIAAEDTRKAKRFLGHFNIKPAELFSHGSHNEHASAKGIIEMVLTGKSIAFISDAGMPGISDPGYLLVSKAVEAGVWVEAIPGVSAVTTALSISGIPSDKFCFLGFLPRQKKAQTELLQKLKNYRETLIFYESPRRVVKTLTAVLENIGNRNVCIARELTKTYEELLRGDLKTVLAELSSRDEVLGEFCIVVQGASEEDLACSFDLDGEIKFRLNAGISVKQASVEIAKEYGLKKSDVYSRCLALRSM